MKKRLSINNLTKVALFTVATILVGTTRVYALDCETNYGGCSVEKKFKIEKYVRLEGDNNWHDEVTVDLNDSDEAKKKIEFKVVITNKMKGDNVDVSGLDIDNMKSEDRWPDELKFLDDESKNKLTEEWDNFKSNTSKTFYLTGKILDSEKNKGGNFQKCVVNKVELYHDGDEVDQDDAVVCYKKVTESEVLGATTELPKTGASEVAGLVGVLLTGTGIYLKKKS